MQGTGARLRHGLRDESGQAVVLAAMAMVAILSFAGLAIDVGQFRYEKSQLQAAADAAAVAGALELGECGGVSDCATMKTAAQKAVAENGFTISNSNLLTQCATNSGTGLTLTVNNGPCALGSSSADPNYGNTGYVEAVISYAEPTYFARVLGINSMNIVVRSEAGQANSPNCMFVSAGNTGSGAGSAITMNSNSNLTASCGVEDESGASGALMADSGANLTATAISVHGTVTKNGTLTLSPTPTIGAATVPDPLSWVPAPTVGSCSSNVSVNSGQKQTLNPGTYCGINVNSNGSVTLNAGTYVMTGSINVDSSSTLTGNGVTIYFSSGSLQMNSGSTANLVAPTTGTYAGILIYEGKSDSQAMAIDSGSTSVYQGAIYLPDAQLTLNSGGNAAVYTIVDVASLMVDSGNKFTLGNNYSSLPGGSPAKAGALLVE